MIPYYLESAFPSIFIEFARTHVYYTHLYLLFYQKHVNKINNLQLVPHFSFSNN